MPYGCPSQSLLRLLLLTAGAVLLSSFVQGAALGEMREQLDLTPEDLEGVSSSGESLVVVQSASHWFTLALKEQDESVVFPKIRAKYTQLPTVRFFSGHVQEFQKSFVHLSLHMHELAISGTILTEAGDFTVETKDGVVWLVQTVKTKGDFTIEDGPESTATPSASQDLGRARREAGGTVCTLFVDVDSKFLAHWGVGANDKEQEAAAVMKVMDIVSEVVAIFEHNFDSAFHLRLLGIKFLKATIFDLPTQPSSGVSVLEAYQTFLAAGVQGGIAAKVRGIKYPTSQDACLNVLLTHVDLNGVTGAAQMGNPSASSLGGICDDRVIASDFDLKGTPKAWNTLAVTTLANNAPIDDATFVRTLAHEIGHSFGAFHTCCLGSSCTASTSCARFDGNECHPLNNYYLMYPKITYGTNSINFSPCSKPSILATVASRSWCFTLENPATTTTTTTKSTRKRRKSKSKSTAPTTTTTTTTPTSSTTTTRRTTTPRSTTTTTAARAL